MHRLGKPGSVRIDLLVCRIGSMSVGESHRRFHNAIYLLEVMLCPPETAPGKKNVLTVFYLQDTVHLMFYERTSLTFQQNAGFKTL